MGRTRDGVGASGGVEASLLPASDLFAGSWGLASSSYFPVRSVGGLLQRLCQARDPEAIVMEF